MASEKHKSVNLQFNKKIEEEHEEKVKKQPVNKILNFVVLPCMESDLFMDNYDVKQPMKKQKSVQILGDMPEVEHLLSKESAQRDTMMTEIPEESSNLANSLDTRRF